MLNMYFDFSNIYISRAEHHIYKCRSNTVCQLKFNSIVIFKRHTDCN